MSEKLICPICGEPTSAYMGNYRKDLLCKKHAADLKSGKLVKCEKCGEWHYIDQPCKCSNHYAKLPTDGFERCVICGELTSGYAFCKKCFKKHSEEELLDILNGISKALPDSNLSVDSNENNPTVVVNSENKSKCITCGKPTDGLLFCPSCYHKYKDKELLFKITKCTNVELLSDDYEGKYVCKDGHIVKSGAERDIDDYLFDHGIAHAYEKALPYGRDLKEVLHPDFCLKDYLGKGNDVLLEHWGYNENNIQYTKTKKFKMKIYEELCSKNKITLISTFPKDIIDVEASLNRKLNKDYIHLHEINFDD